MVWWGGWQRSTQHPGPITCGQRYRKHVRCSATKRKTKVGHRETEARQCKKVEKYLLLWSSRCGVQGNSKNAWRKLKVPMPAAVPCKIRWRKVQGDLQLFWYSPWQNTRASWKPANLWEIVQKELHIKIMKTTLQEQGSIHWTITILRTNFPVPQAKIPEAKAAVDKECENLEKIPAWQMTKVRNKKEVIDEARKQSKTVHVCVINGSLSSQEYRIGGKASKIQRSSRAPRWVSERWFRLIRSIYRAKFICVTNDSCKSNGCQSKATRMSRTSSRRSISLHPSPNGRCTVIIENSKVRMSRYLDSSTKTQMAEIMVQHGRSSRSS